eukprot:scaffold236816_cov16-Tisochrysis_lutea.AAC.2
MQCMNKVCDTWSKIGRIVCFGGGMERSKEVTVSGGDAAIKLKASFCPMSDSMTQTTPVCGRSLVVPVLDLFPGYKCWWHQ